MRKLATLMIGFLLMTFSVQANSTNLEETTIYGNYGKSYIFVVGTVEFSVFPDGQFDFTYIGNNNVTLSTNAVNISYNSGYNYDMYVQYDQYGAVLQIEDIPIYYDEFGRIAQAGDVEIRYNQSRIVRVGGLQIYYNRYGYYSYCTGYINPYNYYYVYQPWHVFYVRPVYASCVVYDYPYRRYYTPTRYTYYDHQNYYSNRGRSNVAYNNGRRSFERPGSRLHFEGGRSVANKDYNPNRRNTAYASSSKVENKNRKTSTKTSSRSKSIKKDKPLNTSRSSRLASNTKNNRKTNTVRTQKTSFKKSSTTNKNNRAIGNTTKTIKKSSTNKTYKRSNTVQRNSTKVASNTRGNSSKNNTKTTRSSSKKTRGL